MLGLVAGTQVPEPQLCLRQCHEHRSLGGAGGGQVAAEDTEPWQRRVPMQAGVEAVMGSRGPGTIGQIGSY